MRAHARAAPAVTPGQRGGRRRPPSWRRGRNGTCTRGAREEKLWWTTRVTAHARRLFERMAEPWCASETAKSLTAARRQGPPPPVLNVDLTIIRSARQRSHRLRWVSKTKDCAFRWGLGVGKAMEGWPRSQPPAAGGTCAAAAFGRANVPRARAPTRRRRRPRPQSWAPLGGDEAPAAKIFWCTLPCVVVYQARTKPSGGVAGGGGCPLAGSSMLDLLLAGVALPADLFFFSSGAVSLSSSRAALWYSETSTGPAIDIDTRTIIVSGK
ncbi:uncharacterized protein LOC120709460 [Panicum virgatum]|uniref:Uncharacterized protein n=1 Tax=Panicum virgatum TaxID=38727 RepID=A0A8T0XS85_PANVG|nr:uncharacterized protein LOC120709460 [Panicum virgatum]KAG2660003.1 hypothetical protein PVAP13_1KG388500 [Panicum virgatum]